MHSASQWGEKTFEVAFHFFIYAHKEEQSGGTVDGSQNLQPSNFTDKNIFDNSY